MRCARRARSRRAPGGGARRSGLCLVLDALVTTVTGVEPARPAGPPRAGDPRRARRPPHQPPPGPGRRVQYLLADTDEAAVARLHERLAAVGDSLVIVGVDTPTGREWNVHVHVADIGAAIEAGIEAGRPHRISVTAAWPPVRPGRPRAGYARDRRGACPSDGLAELFAAEGAGWSAAVPTGVTEDDVLAEIIASMARDVSCSRTTHRWRRRPRTLPPGRVDLAPRGRRRAHALARPGLAALAVRRSPSGASGTTWDRHGRGRGGQGGPAGAEVTIAEQEALTSAEGTVPAGDDGARGSRPRATSWSSAAAASPPV